MTSLTRFNRTWPSWGSPLRLFEDAFPAFFGTAFSEDFRNWSPAVDVSEGENSLTFTVEVPGFSKDDLSISVEKGMLTLSGERKLERKRDEFHRIERAYGRFERSFSLPTTVDADKIEADLKNGLLTVLMPKKAEARPKQIPVGIH